MSTQEKETITHLWNFFLNKINTLKKIIKMLVIVLKKVLIKQ